jgi:nitrite reductase/ring-hydroxylating ferredoxin subunit
LRANCWHHDPQESAKARGKKWLFSAKPLTSSRANASASRLSGIRLWPSSTSGKFFVTDDTCTHGQASLCDGFLEGTVVECPFHAGTFEVSTGEALSYPATDPVKTYAVRIDGDDVVVDLDLEAHGH